MCFIFGVDPRLQDASNSLEGFFLSIAFGPVMIDCATFCNAKVLVAVFFPQ